MLDPSVAVIVAVTLAVTDFVDTVKVAEVVPAAICTEAGTMAFVLLDFRVTVSPPVGAAPFRLTVPVAVMPPVTGEGSIDTLTSDAGLIVNDVVTVVESRTAVIVEVIVEA